MKTTWTKRDEIALAYVLKLMEVVPTSAFVFGFLGERAYAFADAMAEARKPKSAKKP